MKESNDRDKGCRYKCCVFKVFTTPPAGLRIYPYPIVLSIKKPYSERRRWPTGVPLRKTASRPNIGTFLVETERKRERARRVFNYIQTKHHTCSISFTLTKSTNLIHVGLFLVYLIKYVPVHSTMCRSLLAINSLDFDSNTADRLPPAHTRFTCTYRRTHNYTHSH